MKNNHSKTYTITAIIAIALASMLVLAPNALAAKQTTSGVHFQGGAPRIVQTSNGPTVWTWTVNQFTIAGLGQGVGTATLDVKGQFTIICDNPADNKPPGQKEIKTEASDQFDFTAQNGKANVGPLQVSFTAPTQDEINALCAQGNSDPQKWSGSLGGFTLTSATLVITFTPQGGSPIQIYP